MKTFGQYVGSDEIVTLSDASVITILNYVKLNPGCTMDALFDLEINAEICVSALVARCVRLNFLSTKENETQIEYRFSSVGFDRVENELKHALIILKKEENSSKLLGSNNLFEMFNRENILEVMFEIQGFTDLSGAVEIEPLQKLRIH